MVAAAGAIQGMPRVWAMFCLLLTVVCLLGQIPIRQRRTAFFHGALDAPPDVLAHQSRTTAESFGYTRKPADTDIWLEHRWDLVNYLSSLPQPRRWDEWYAAEAPIVSFYRESPQPLDARPFGLVTALNPPPFTAGMATVILDGNGRLADFSAVPYAAGSATVSPETVFRAGGTGHGGLYGDRSRKTCRLIRSTSGTPGRGRTRRFRKPNCWWRSPHGRDRLRGRR